MCCRFVLLARPHGAILLWACCLSQARLFLKLGRQADAEAAYRGLIAINTENYRYHAGLQAALQLPAAAAGAAGALDAAAAAAAAEQQLSEEQRQRLAEVYGELQREHPHSTAAHRMTLDFLVRLAWAVKL